MITHIPLLAETRETAQAVEKKKSYWRSFWALFRPKDSSVETWANIENTSRLSDRALDERIVHLRYSSGRCL